MTSKKAAQQLFDEGYKFTYEDPTSQECIYLYYSKETTGRGALIVISREKDNATIYYMEEK